MRADYRRKNRGVCSETGFTHSRVCFQLRTKGDKPNPWKSSGGRDVLVGARTPRDAPQARRRIPECTLGIYMSSRSGATDEATQVIGRIERCLAQPLLPYGKFPIGLATRQTDC